MNKLDQVYSFFFEESVSENKKSNRFDFLDGYRGLLCLLVILQHGQGIFLMIHI